MCREAQGSLYLVKCSFKQQGVSLLELLSSLTVVSILSTFGVDGYQYFYGHSKADKEINHLRATLALARSEAVSRDSLVVLCRKSSLNLECQGNSSRGQQSWSNGWLLFSDTDNDRLYTPGTDELIRQTSTLDLQSELKWNRGDYVAFQGSGSLGSLNGTFCLRWGDQDDFSRELKIPFTGRVRETRGECTYQL